MPPDANPTIPPQVSARGVAGRFWIALEILLVPLLCALFAVLYQRDRSQYLRLTEEDELLEWMTFAFLFGAGLLLVRVAPRLRRGLGRSWLFLGAFGVFCLLAAMEEISWGQRVLQVESPAFFEEYSDQQEINAHNVLQQALKFKTKNVAQAVLFVYGVCVPLLLRGPRGQRLCRRVGCVIPPIALVPGFLLGVLLMYDVPTGQEEEIGEFVFSLCFLLFAIRTLRMPAEPSPPIAGRAG